MQVTLSSKGQLVLPAPVRRRLRLKAKARLELEEREGGVFLRPVKAKTGFEPIEYPRAGSLKVNKRMLELDKLAGPDLGPEDV
jgi:AbrB family looped-hinge helix DNA binding protein